MNNEYEQGMIAVEAKEKKKVKPLPLMTHPKQQLRSVNVVSESLKLMPQISLIFSDVMQWLESLFDI